MSSGIRVAPDWFLQKSTGLLLVTVVGCSGLVWFSQHLRFGGLRVPSDAEVAAAMGYLLFGFILPAVPVITWSMSTTNWSTLDGEEIYGFQAQWSMALIIAICLLMWVYVGSVVLLMEYPDPNPPTPVQKLTEPPKAGEPMWGQKPVQKTLSERIAWLTTYSSAILCWVFGFELYDRRERVRRMKQPPSLGGERQAEITK